MKKIIILFCLAITCLAQNAHAFYYDAKCLNPEGKLKKCFIDFSKSDHLSVRYKDLEYQNLNREIAGKKITNIAGNSKSKFRVGATIGTTAYFGPMGALMLLWKKKMITFGVEFKTTHHESETVIFSVKKKQGYAVASQLQSISDKTVNFQAFTKK